MRPFLLCIFASLIYIPLFSQVDLTNGLAAYYPFNGNANDASGNGNNPIFNNATPTTDRAGNPNGAYLFNGSSYMRIPNSPSLNPSRITLYALVKPTGFYYGPCHGNAIINKGSDDNNMRGKYRMRFDENLYTFGANCSTSIPDTIHQNYYADFAGNGALTASYTPYVTKEEWACIIFTFDGSMSKFYINGTLISQRVTTATYTPENTDLFFGRLDNALFPYWFKGVIDEIRIYNRALNADEVNALCSTNRTLDFTFKQDVCNPLSVQFFSAETVSSPYWSFGDGNTNTTDLNPVNVFPSFGNYTVKFKAQNGDTITKTVPVFSTRQDIVLTPDTTICFGATAQLRSVPSLNFCWTPTTYLNDPNSRNPVTSTPIDITYYLTAEVAGTNLVTNGNFNNGNTGFTSQYVFTATNNTEGQYFVGANPQAWNGALSNCPDHTGGNGQMLLVNGASVPGVNVWSQTVSVTPNTNYAFSTWIQALHPSNPAQLQFSINGKNVGELITATLPPCTWKQFYVTWNSGAMTSASLSIVNKNTIVAGNDFALDDISFAAVSILRDSVIVRVDTAVVTAVNDLARCQGDSALLNATGAQSYSWFPPAGLSNPNVPNPKAAPSSTTQYIVTGTSPRGCFAKDTVILTVNPKPLITLTADTAICKASNVQLLASGGTVYSWSPAATLNNASVPNPVATPPGNTVYTVVVTNSDGCVNSDSLEVSIRPEPVFTISPARTICDGDQITMTATGGDTYLWTPSALVSDATAATVQARPATTTVFSVNARENLCGYDSLLQVTVNVNPTPLVSAQKSNDIDCALPVANLRASGATNYNWAPSTGLDFPNSESPTSSASVTTLYTVTGTNQFGCKASDTVTVKVTNGGKPVFEVPNAFTPNGDGINDCFGIRRWARVNELEFMIFNRWGQKVFSTTDPARCWDGKLNGKLQDSGGFTYIIQAKSACGTIFKKGMVLLIR